MFSETILHATKYLSIRMLKRLIILDTSCLEKYLPLLNPIPDSERVPGQDLTNTIPTNEFCSYIIGSQYINISPDQDDETLLDITIHSLFRSTSALFN